MSAQVSECIPISESGCLQSELSKMASSVPSQPALSKQYKILSKMYIFPVKKINDKNQPYAKSSEK